MKRTASRTTTKRTSSSTTRSERAGQTRAAILRAAVKEFSAHGLSGARTDAIASSANVNKALLYYHFKDKHSLYAAAIHEVSGKVIEDALANFDSRFSPGERLLRTSLTHFDRILTQGEFQSLMQQEMVRFRRGEPGSLPGLFSKAFQPLIQKLREAVAEGVRIGELCEMDWLQVLYSIFGANVFYFLSAPLMQRALPIDLLNPKALKDRRKAAVQFLGKALFTDRAHGSALAARLLLELPMPRPKKPTLRASETQSRRKAA